MSSNVTSSAGWDGAAVGRAAENLLPSTLHNLPQAEILTKAFKEASARLRGGEHYQDDLSLESVIGAGIHYFGMKGVHPTRYFHDAAHFLKIMKACDSAALKQVFINQGISEETQAAIRAVMIRAGAHHDVVYIHNDKEFAPGVSPVVAPYIAFERGHAKEGDKNPSNYLMTTHREEFKKDTILQAANILFGIHEGQVLSPFENQNEYLSALYAGIRGEKSGMPLKYVLAEMAMIEATVPWGAEDRIERLGKRLEEVNNLLPEAQQLSANEIKATLIGAREIAMIDVLGISDTKQFHVGTLMLMRESGMDITNESSILNSISKQVGFLKSKVPPFETGEQRIFHPHAEFKEEGDRLEVQGIANFKRESIYMESLAIAVALKTRLRSTTLPEADAETRKIFESSREALLTKGKDDHVEIPEDDKITPVLAKAAGIYTLFKNKPEILDAMAHEIFTNENPSVKDNVFKTLKTHLVPTQIHRHE